MGRKAAASLVIAILLAVALVGSEEPIIPPECSDGIDNDGDGGIDVDNGTGHMHDFECEYVFHPLGDLSQPPITMMCPNWDDESTPPSSQYECDGGA